MCGTWKYNIFVVGFRIRRLYPQQIDKSPPLSKKGVFLGMTLNCILRFGSEENYFIAIILSEPKW